MSRPPPAALCRRPDPFAPLPPLEPPDESGQGYRGGNGYRNGALMGMPPELKLVEPDPLPAPPIAVRTALTVEPARRQAQRLHAPAENAADYFALLAAVEAAAEAIDVQVQLEGYPPPYDPRIHVIR